VYRFSLVLFSSLLSRHYRTHICNVCVRCGQELWWPACLHIVDDVDWFLYVLFRCNTAHCGDRLRRIQSLADMGYMVAVFYSRAKVPSYRSLEYFHHEGEQRTGQSCIPTAFGMLVADERVLSLNLKKLYQKRNQDPEREGVRGRCAQKLEHLHPRG
jgi:hypothetical protein